MWQSPELGGCPNSGRPFYSICNWTLCVQQKQIPESGMWFCLPHLHAYLKGGTFRSPLCFQHQFSHGSRESRRCSPFLHSFFSKMLQSCNVAMLQSLFRCRRGGEEESLNERTNPRRARHWRWAEIASVKRLNLQEVCKRLGGAKTIFKILFII